MAYNVFGNAVTNFTLEGLPEYVGKTITRKDRAYVALNMKNAQEKDRNARAYVEKLKEQSGAGVSNLCLIYNATGDAVTLVKNHDWYGGVGLAPYPVRVENGQWAAFLHVKSGSASSGSTAAIVYRGLNGVGQSCDWMAAWSNPWDRTNWDNMVYTEIQRGGYYDNNDKWGQVSEKLYKSTLYLEAPPSYGCVSIVSTGSGYTAIFEAIFTLENAVQPAKS